MPRKDPETVTVRLLAPLKMPDGAEHYPPSVVELPAAEANRLVQQGSAEEVPG
jgi:hypothetical protein